MSNSGNFSGVLDNDSPQLLGLIKRHLSTHLQILNDAYHLAWERGGCKEDNILREVGVSFNPRPARIATLLLSDGAIRDPDIIRRGLLTSVEDCSCLPVVSLAQDIDTLRHLHMSSFSTSEIVSIISSIADRSQNYSVELNKRLYEIYIGTLDRCRKKYL